LAFRHGVPGGLAPSAARVRGSVRGTGNGNGTNGRKGTRQPKKISFE
jgi:hypothetical protein